MADTPEAEVIPAVEVILPAADIPHPPQAIPSAVELPMAAAAAGPEPADINAKRIAQKEALRKEVSPSLLKVG